MLKHYMTALVASCAISFSAAACAGQDYDRMEPEQGGMMMRQEAMMTRESPPSVPVASGGIGDGDMEYLQSIQHQFNVKLLLTENSGAYLADLPVRVKDGKGNIVLDTVSEGPVLLMQLPKGNYTAMVSGNGVEREQRISAGSSLKTYQLRFPNTDMDRPMHNY